MKKNLINLICKKGVIYWVLLPTFFFSCAKDGEKTSAKQNLKEVVERKQAGDPRFPLPDEEPICRVGIVLESDNKSYTEIVLPTGEFKIEDDGTKKILKCEAQKPLRIEVLGDTIVCNEISGKELLRSKSFISIQRFDEKEIIAPQSGILLKGVVAGRGFHWQKEVNLYFPFKLEFHHRNTNLIVVNEIPLEPYLACVVTSEMSAECPPEFIKAQATAARSWMVVNLKDKHKGVPYTICNDDCCQRYQGTTYLSMQVAGNVAETRGMFLVTESGNVCSAFYSKCCGGIIENTSNIFGKAAVGLSDSIDAPQDSVTARFNPINKQSIREWLLGDWLKKSDSFCSPNICPEKELPEYLGAVDETASYYRWKVVYTQEEMVELLKKKAHLNDVVEFLDFRPGFRGNSGRLHQLEVLYRTEDAEKKSHTIRTQYRIRNVLHEKFLFSSAFTWDYERNGEGTITKIILRGAGWGHGTGLCQMGALGMALKGYSYQQILKHYYNKTSLKKAYK